MANINIGVNFSGGTPPGPSGPGGGTGGKPKPGGGNAPGNDPGRAAAEAAAREAAARRALTQRMGKTFTDAQIAQVARDFAEMSRSSQRLKRFGGDMEKWMNGFSQTFPSQRQSNRHYHEVMQQLGIGSQQQGGAGVGGMISQAVRGMFRATGAGGGVAGGIMHQSYNNARDADGGMGSAGGMGMLGKGAGIAALAYVGIKAVQKVGQKVGDAQDEAVQYHDLRQSVGAVSVDFETLRDSVRHFTSGLGVTSAESAKLARSYAASSQVFGADAQMGIGAAVGQGTKLSRGYGLAPEAGVDFLATMRHFKASDGSEKDNRKLAYLIGDAVGKTGAFSKAGDVMTAIAQFTESATRQSLNVANVADYAGMLGALGGLKLPGMDAKGAASVVGRVQSNWANGGGEPGLNMRLGWAQSAFGALATDMGTIGDAGPMGSAMKSFGKGSARHSLALASGDKAEAARLERMAAAGGDRLFYDREMDAMKGSHDSQFLPSAVAAKYGVSDTEARSLIASHGKEGGMTGLMDRVKAAVKAGGKDPEQIKEQNIGLLSMIDNADSKGLSAMRDQAKKLGGKNALSQTELSALNGANSDSELKTVLTQIHAMRVVEDEGKTARQAQVDLDRKFQEFATKIIPLTNMIQEGIFKMLDKAGGLSPDMKAFQESKKLDARLGKLDPEDAKGRQALLDSSVAEAKLGPMSAAEERDRRNAITGKAGSPASKEKEIEGLLAEKSRRENVPEQIRNLMANGGEKASGGRESSGKIGGLPVAGNARKKPDGGSSLSDSEKAYLAETDRLLGAAPGTSEAQIMVESNGDHNAVSPRGAKGLGQIMPKEQSVMEGRMGRKITTREDQLEAHRLMMQENLKRFKTNEKAQKAYNGGWNESKWGNKETSEYTEKIAAIRDSQIPDAARPASGTQSANVNVRAVVDFNHPDGRREEREMAAGGQFQQTVAGQRSRG